MTGTTRVDKRTELLDAAVRCFVAKGITRTTMEDIVREAEVGKATLYRYFGNKDAVVDALVERERVRFDRLLRDAAAAASDGGHAVQQAFLAGLQFLRSHPMLTKSLAEEPDRLLPYLTVRSGLIAQTGLAVFNDLISGGVASGALRQDLHVDWTAETLFRLLLSFFTIPAITVPLDDDDAVRRYARGLVACLVLTWGMVGRGHVRGGVRGTVAHNLELNTTMGLIIILIVLAVLFGLGGLLLEGLQWLLIIAVVLLIAGLITGSRGRR